MAAPTTAAPPVATAPIRPTFEPHEAETQTTEGPGENTQALAVILSALGSIDTNEDDGGGGGGGGGDGDGQQGSLLSGRDVLSLLENETRASIQDEADAWKRTLPPSDVLHTGPSSHDVYRARAANLIQAAPQFLPNNDLPSRQRSLPEDGQIRDRMIRNHFSVEEHRVTKPIRRVAR